MPPPPAPGVVASQPTSAEIEAHVQRMREQERRRAIWDRRLLIGGIVFATVMAGGWIYYGLVVRPRRSA